MKAFLTGIEGFVGSHLAEYLLRQNDQVAGSLRPKAFANAGDIHLAAAVEKYAWDITESAPPALVESLSRFQPDCIFHLASISVPSDCGKTEATPLATAVNVGGTVNVVDLARRLPSQPRVIFISTSHVYATVETIGQKVDENWPTQPRGAYGKTKLSAERVIRSAVDNHGLDAVVVRAFQHAGPRQRPELMLAQWCEQIARGKAPLQILNRDSYIDMTDVRDVVRAYRDLALANIGGVFNIGSGRAVRSGDLFDWLCQRYAPDWEIVELSPGVRPRAIADIRRIIQAIDWTPQIPVEQTMQDSYEYWHGIVQRATVQGD